MDAFETHYQLKMAEVHAAEAEAARIREEIREATARREEIRVANAQLEEALTRSRLALKDAQDIVKFCQSSYLNAVPVYGYS